MWTVDFLHVVAKFLLGRQSHHKIIVKCSDLNELRKLLTATKR